MAPRLTVTVYIPDGYATGYEFAKDCGFEVASLEIHEWQNMDLIIDALERAGCCRDGYVIAPEDVVANAIRDWLRALQPS